MQARQCGHCGAIARWDESFSSARIGDANAQACEQCQAKARGELAHAPRRYPPGSKIPRGPTGGDIPICGLCRVALPESQQKGTPLRIRAEMLHENDITEPGSYVVCRTCLDEWRPRIVAWLKRLCRTCDRLDCEEEGHVRALGVAVEPRTVAGNMLL